jgi:hypothetical protein
LRIHSVSAKTKNVSLQFEREKKGNEICCLILPWSQVFYMVTVRYLRKQAVRELIGVYGAVTGIGHTTVWLRGMLKEESSEDSELVVVDVVVVVDTVDFAKVLDESVEEGENDSVGD